MRLEDSFDLRWPFLVTDEMARLYERDGVVILRRPFCPALVGGLSARMESIIDALALRESNLLFRASPGRMEIYNAVRSDALFRRFVFESRAAEISAKVCKSMTSRFYFDVTFCKFGHDRESADAAATSLHHDVAAFGFKGRQLPSLWLALTNVPLEAGPLVVALGSHLLATDLFRSQGDYGGESPAANYRDHADAQKFVDDSRFEMKPFPLEAGDAVLIHPYVLHASLPARTTGTRRIGFCTRWIGDDVRWWPSPYTRQEELSYRHPLKPGSTPPAHWFSTVWPVACRGAGAA